MAITLTLPSSGEILITDVPDLVGFISVGANVTGFSSTQIIGSGTYDGTSSSFVVTGTGFTVGFLGGEPTLISGVVDTISFTSSFGTFDITSVDIDMSVFASIVQADTNGSAPLAIETFMMNKAWNITLSDEDDIAPAGTMVGDGIKFNTKGNDTIRGLGGNDNLFSGDGKDKLYGNIGNDILNGGRAADLIKGGSGRDRLLGSQGNDKLFGDSGRDTLKGGDGKDVLDGGVGNDILTGGKNPDKFVFKNGFGRDKITDFNANNNLEDINLKAVNAIKSFNDLKNNHMSKSGANVIIDDNHGNQITLVGVDIGDLNKGDFIF